MASKRSGAFEKSKEEGTRVWEEGLPSGPLPPCPSPPLSLLTPILAVSRAYKGHKLSMTKTKPNTFSPYLALLPDFLTLHHPTIRPFSLAPNLSSPPGLAYPYLLLRPNDSIAKLSLILPSTFPLPLPLRESPQCPLPRLAQVVVP